MSELSMRKIKSKLMKKDCEFYNKKYHSKSICSDGHAQNNLVTKQPCGVQKEKKNNSCKDIKINLETIEFVKY